MVSFNGFMQIKKERNIHGENTNQRDIYSTILVWIYTEKKCRRVKKNINRNVLNEKVRRSSRTR